MKIGAYNDLRVQKITEQGYLLTTTTNEPVKLSYNECGDQTLLEGEYLSAFVFLDQLKVPSCTLFTPSMVLGQTKTLSVVGQREGLGVFLESGFKKDFLVPQRFLPASFADWPALGQPLTVKLCYEPTKGLYCDLLDKTYVRSKAISPEVPKSTLYAGRLNHLTVLEKINTGFLLVNEQGDEVGMMFNETNHQTLEVGQTLDAYIYYDKGHQLCASLDPYILCTDEIGQLQVVGVNPTIGVFVSNGLKKDFLIPKQYLPKNQAAWPTEGTKTLVQLKYDQRHGLYCIQAKSETITDHLEVGKVNSFQVLRQTDLGYLLLGPNHEEVVLHFNDANNQQLLEGEYVKAFVYLDSKSRLSATLDDYYLARDDAGLLTVISVRPELGVFVNNGIKRDILISKFDLPKSPLSWPQVGEKVLVELKYEPKVGLHGVLLHKPLNPLIQEFALPITVATHVTKVSEGYFLAVTDDLVLIVVHKENNRGFHHVGESLNIKLLTQLDNGNYEGSLIENKELMFEQDAATILDYLTANNGVMSLTSKSSAEEVFLALKMSRNGFKRALGTLYSQHRVLFQNDTTILLPQEEK
jgi:predicted RNA-binding protein (virulence factor B family)